MAAPYIIAQGDTLGGIASMHGTTVGDILKANPNITDPNLIKAGGTLTIPGVGGTAPSGSWAEQQAALRALGARNAPTVTDVGIGKLTTIPKGPLSTPAPTAPPAAPDLTGAYARTGITPPVPAPATPATPATPALPTVPQYPTPTSSTPSSTITDSYKALLDSISSIEDKIASASVASPDEQRLSQELAAKKDALAKFDIGSLQATENLYGQGRGITLTTLDRQNQQQQRTRSLQRLGLAQEADTLTNQLGLAQNARTALGDLAKTEYDLASKRLDTALNVSKEMDTIHKNEQDNARQYLLDVIGHFTGKTFDQLDPASQLAITQATANSPITLGMVKTALSSAAEKAQAAADGRLFSVANLGIVQVNPDGTGYKVVVPAVPKAGGSTGLSFEDYVAQQNLPISSLTADRIAQLRTEYDARYGSARAAKGAFTTTQINNGAQNAGLSVGDFTSQPYDVQNFFASAPDSQITALHTELRGVSDGTISVADAKKWVDSSAITPAMKTYLHSKIDTASASVAPPGFWGTIGGAIGTGWNAVTSFLNQ